MKTKTTAPVPSPTKAVSDGETQSKLDRIERFKLRICNNKPARFKKDERTQSIIPDGDRIENELGLREAFGTAQGDFAAQMLQQAAATHREGGPNALNTTIAAASGIKPQDELEGMLAAQMIGVHNLSMEFLERAAKLDNPELVTQNVERATKLLRTFTAQVEALNRYRGKGQQKMTVEHVHVHEGGQAFVGVVDRPASSGLKEGGES